MGSITVPTDGNMWIAAEFGDENLYPWIVTSFWAVSGINGSTASVTMETYLHSFDFAPGIEPEDVTLSVNGSGGLSINIYDWVLVDPEEDIWERVLIGVDEVPYFISGKSFTGYATTIAGDGTFEISDSDFEEVTVTGGHGPTRLCCDLRR